MGFDKLNKGLDIDPRQSFNERTGYIGLLALFLAAVAMVRRRCTFTIFFGALGIGALTIVYGIPPWPTIMRNLPVLQSINQERMLMAVDWSAAVLAALGAETLLRSKANLRPRVLSIAFVFGIACVIGVWWNITGGLGSVDDSTRAFLLSQVWVLAGGLLAVFAVTLRRLELKWVSAICVGWTAIDLLWFASGYNPAIARELYKPTTGAIRFLQDDRSIFRVFGLGLVLPPNTPGMYGLDDVRGQDFMTVSRYEELITGRAGNFFFYMSADRLPPPLAMWNVKYILVPRRAEPDPPDYELVYDAELTIYKNTRYRERALAVFEHRIEPNPAVVLSAVRDAEFDPEKMLWLESEDVRIPGVSNPGQIPGSKDPGLQTDVRITRYEPDDVTIEARMPKPGFVLLLDTYFPGWVATVDGQTTPIYRADYAYRAVSVPAGTHTITFAYRPSSFRWGVGASFLAIGLLAVLWWRGRPRSST